MQPKKSIFDSLQKNKKDQKINYLKSSTNIFKQLKAMRLEAGLTQKEVALKMNTNKSNISRLENQKLSPKWETLENYAHACGYDISLNISLLIKNK